MPEKPEIYSTEAERGVLGCVLIDPDCIHRVRPLIKPEMFHKEHHRWIYQAMLDLADDSTPPDFLTLGDALEQRGQLEKAGDFSYITSLINAVPNSLRAEHYAGIVERDHVRRCASSLGAKIVQLAHQTDDVNDLLGAIHKGVMDLDMRQDRGGPVPISSVVGELYDDLQQWQDDPLLPNTVRGLSTGIPEWDRMMGGMEKGESTVAIVGRSGTGKTALVLTSGYRLAAQGDRVLIFALEMKAKTLLARMAASNSGVNYKKVKRGVKNGSSWYASPDEFSRFTTETLKAANIRHLYIDETQNLTLSQIRARSMTLAQRIGGLDLVIIDTGNLVQSEFSSGKNFAQEESDKVKGFRNLTKELNCVLYFTWQLLTKKIDARPAANFGRAPNLSDLRDTGGVEEHSSDIIGIYRDELHVENSQYKDMMHFFGLKRRNDEAKTMQVAGFDAEHQKFYSVDLHRKEIAY